MVELDDKFMSLALCSMQGAEELETYMKERWDILEGDYFSDNWSPELSEEDEGSSGGCSSRHVSDRASEEVKPEQDGRKRRRVPTAFYANERDGEIGRAAAATVYTDDKPTGKQVVQNTQKNQKIEVPVLPPPRQKRKANVVFKDEADEQRDEQSEEPPRRTGRRLREPTAFYSNQQGNEILSANKGGSTSKRNAVGVRHCGICRDPGHDSRNCPHKRAVESLPPPPQEHTAVRSSYSCGTCGQFGHNSRTCPQTSKDAAGSSFQDLAGAIVASANNKREENHERRGDLVITALQTMQDVQLDQLNMLRGLL